MSDSSNPSAENEDSDAITKERLFVAMRKELIRSRVELDKALSRADQALEVSETRGEELKSLAAELQASRDDGEKSKKAMVDLANFLFKIATLDEEVDNVAKLDSGFLNFSESDNISSLRERVDELIEMSSKRFETDLKEVENRKLDKQANLRKGNEVEILKSELENVKREKASLESKLSYANQNIASVTSSRENSESNLKTAYETSSALRSEVCKLKIDLSSAISRRDYFEKNYKRSDAQNSLLREMVDPKRRTGFF